jgi:hypothetical protein
MRRRALDSSAIKHFGRTVFLNPAIIRAHKDRRRNNGSCPRIAANIFSDKQRILRIELKD